VPVAGLLRDAIVGITCFPDPLPKGRKRSSRRWWLHAKRPWYQRPCGGRRALLPQPGGL